MGRYIGPKEKIERRLGAKLFLKGERSHSPKSAMTKRPYSPGMHGKKQRRKMSEYGQQLNSKQKIRNTYRLMEKQFKGIVKKAMKSRSESVDTIVRELESRLDNVVFRSGFAQSRDQARQLVGHGHILVNGKKINIPSYRVNKGELVSVKENSIKTPYFSSFVPQFIKKQESPNWITVDTGSLKSSVTGVPTLEESGLDSSDLRAIIEFYSR